MVLQSVNVHHNGGNREIVLYIILILNYTSFQTLTVFFICRGGFQATFLSVLSARYWMMKLCDGCIERPVIVDRFFSLLAIYDVQRTMVTSEATLVLMLTKLSVLLEWHFIVYIEWYGKQLSFHFILMFLVILLSAHFFPLH